MRPNSGISFLYGLLLLFCSPSISGQGENDIWYFGIFAGVNFSGNNPTTLVNSGMNAPGACAAISNPEGELLFYTNGTEIWNKLHMTMENGNSLAGNAVSTQTRIVPLPGSEHIYFLFTTDRLGWPNGFRYSIVDMEEQNGLGSVVSKNILLFTPSTEKIAVAKHCNEMYRWIIAHETGNNHFRSYLLKTSGLDAQPVVSQSGQDYHVGSGSTGYLKASLDGHKLASVSRLGEEYGRLEIFDFDRASGKVSNARLLDSLVYEVYGLEFSPDGNKIYFATGIQNGGQVFQIDLTPASWEASMQSLQVVSQEVSFNSQLSALQIGPDEKIYLSKRNHSALGIIHHPNLAGFDCLYEDDGLDLAGRRARSGLPDRVVSREDDPFIEFSLSCAGEPSHFEIQNYQGLDSVIWNFGDPESGNQNVISGWNPNHSFSRPGNFVVRTTVYHPCGSYALNKEVEISGIPEFSVPEQLILCEHHEEQIDLSSYPYQFFLNLLEVESIIRLYDPGEYEISAGNICGETRKTIQVVSLEERADQNFQFCKGDTLWVQPDDFPPGSTISWPDGSDEYFYPVSDPGRIDLQIVNGSCIVNQSLIVDFEDCTDVCRITFVPNVFSPNFDGINDIFLPYGCIVGNYSMQLFDRWGSLIFESTDPDFGWDGSFRGNFLPEGIFVWMIRYTDISGNFLMETGDVLLIR